MIEPKTYRKKPVHVTAKKLTDRASMLDIVEWIGENHHSHIQHPPAAYTVRIDTLEGIMTARIGDYVVRGVAGEFYPVKPKIFAATYEEIDQDGNRVNSTQYPSSFWEAMSDYFQECQAVRQSDFTVWPPDPVPASDHASLW